MNFFKLEKEAGSISGFKDCVKVNLSTDDENGAPESVYILWDEFQKLTKKKVDMLIFIENKIQKKIAKIQKKGEQYSRGKCAQFLEDHQTKLNRIENRMVIPLSNDTAIFYFVDFNSATTAIVLRLKLMNFRRAENGAAIPLGRKTGHDGPRAI